MKPALIFLPIFIPFAACWAKWHEARIQRLGSPLAGRDLEDARQMGVAHPEKIRVLEVDGIPFFNGPFLRLVSRWIPGLSAGTIGLSLRYGIYLRKPYSSSRTLLAHECVHTGQYERAGGFTAFLWEYFRQCAVDGYATSAMEQEANLRSSELPP